jgi:thioredoxin 1
MNNTHRILILAVLGLALIVVIKNRPAGAPGEPEGPVVAGVPRLVDLGSTTCIPCKMMAPILDDLKRDYAGRLQVQFIDVNANRGAAEKYGIRVIPTQVFIDASGQERARHEGFMSREDILAQWAALGVSLDAPATQPQ